MRYWWVNQNQTYRHEVSGGYMWSPKRNRNGGRNPFYDFMREAAPGDIVFSFADTLIKAIGMVRSHCYEAPKPIEFEQAGAYWENIGWRVDVRFVELKTRMHPSRYMTAIAPHLPTKYAPLQQNGNGLQGVYLTCLSEVFASVLIDLIGREARDLVNVVRDQPAEGSAPAQGLVQWEERELQRVYSDSALAETERQALVTARRGQGIFKKNVMQIERCCRITKVDRIEHLRASHCKPWRDANNQERLDGENGLLLTPNADHLFDRGFISFADDGEVLISPVAHLESLERMGVSLQEGLNVGRFTDRQHRYLAFHRDSVFLESRFLR